MKKILLLLVFVTAAGFAVAQDAEKTESEQVKNHGFYFKLGIGNAFPLSCSAEEGYSNWGASTATFHQKRSSHYSGLNGTIGGGYMFNRYIGVEVDANIALASTEYSYNTSFYYGYFDSASNGWKKISKKDSWKSESTVLLMPCFILQTGGKRRNVYSRIGMVLPLANKLVDNYEGVGKKGVAERTYEYKTRFTLGYTGAVGIKYNVGPHVQLWGEMNFLSFAPFLKEMTMTKATLNGADSLGANLPEERKMNYAFSGSYQANTSNRNGPSPEPTHSMPFGNVGIQLGLALHLGDDGVKQQKEAAAPGKKLFFKMGIGYAFQSAGNSSAIYGTETVDFNYSQNVSRVAFNMKPLSYTAGLNGTFGAGYMFTKHLGVELDANIGLSGKKYPIDIYIKNALVDTGVYDSYSARTATRVETPILLSPALVIQTGGRINIYSRIGIVLPIRNKLVFDNSEYDQSGNEIYAQTTEFKMRFTIGYNAAAGLSYKISDHWHLFGEVNMLSYAPFRKEGILTKSTIRGANTLNIYSAEQKITEYSFSGVTTTSGNNYTMTRSNNEMPTFSHSYSNIGFQAGVAFHL